MKKSQFGIVKYRNQKLSSRPHLAMKAKWATLGQSLSANLHDRAPVVKKNKRQDYQVYSLPWMDGWILSNFLSFSNQTTHFHCQRKRINLRLEPDFINSLEPMTHNVIVININSYLVQVELSYQFLNKAIGARPGYCLDGKLEKSHDREKPQKTTVTNHFHTDVKKTAWLFSPES